MFRYLIYLHLYVSEYSCVRKCQDVWKITIVIKQQTTSSVFVRNHKQRRLFKALSLMHNINISTCKNKTEVHVILLSPLLNNYNEIMLHTYF
jgi:hypothetical protein